MSNLATSVIGLLVISLSACTIGADTADDLTEVHAEITLVSSVPSEVVASVVVENSGSQTICVSHIAFGIDFSTIDPKLMSPDAGFQEVDRSTGKPVDYLSLIAIPAGGKYSESLVSRPIPLSKIDFPDFNEDEATLARRREQFLAAMRTNEFNFEAGVDISNCPDIVVSGPSPIEISGGLPKGVHFRGYYAPPLEKVSFDLKD